VADRAAPPVGDAASESCAQAQGLIGFSQPRQAAITGETPGIERGGQRQVG
jgi:hypothetical protein